MNDKLERMIIMQAGAQRETYGYHFTEMSKDELIDYIRVQQQAAIQELGEALNEVDWKQWTQGERQIRRDKFINELIDTLKFWFNLVLAVSGRMEATEIADEIFTRFAIKTRINDRRQADGYDGRSTKCGGCGRALDDPAVGCNRRGNQGFCALRDADVNYLDVVEPAGVEEVVKCIICDQDVRSNGCEPPTTDRWGYCMADVESPRNVPPIKTPTT